MLAYLQICNVNRFLELKNILTSRGSENLFSTCQDTCLPLGFKDVVSLLQRQQCQAQDFIIN